MTKDSSVATGFRGDINGLRAWAVAAVVLYHFGAPGFSGGFVGVDIFFVISGFLMTGIVVSGLERRTFSLLAFYLARARRILPALIVLCAVLVVLGWWALLPPDYKTLGSHAMFSLAFLSNIKFWSEAGYFDAASHEKWLLHTWSLAVEWQFYLLLPLVLMAVWKWRPGRRFVMIAMAAGLLASLALSVVSTPLLPTAAFYMLPTRAWELLAGGMVYLLANRWMLNARQRAALEAAGIGLVIASIAGFDTSSPWPGWRALVPVVGTAAVLLAARRGSRWTENWTAQWLGTRSYSIYLWHWPIVVALTYLGWQADPKAIAVGVLMTLVMGHFSYRLVETSASYRLVKLQQVWGAAALAGAAIVVVTAGALVRLNDGVAGRFSPEIEAVAAEKNNYRPRREECHLLSGIASPSCMFGGSELRAISLGDSHAGMIVTALAAAAPQPNGGVMEWSYSYCSTVFGVHPAPSTKRGSAYHCDRFLEWVKEKVERIPGDVPIVITNRTTQSVFGPVDTAGPNASANIPEVYFTNVYDTATPEFLAEFSKQLVDTACYFAKSRPVYMVRPIPEMPGNVSIAMTRAMVWGQQNEVSISLAQYHQRHAFVWAAQDNARKRCGIKILDPLPYLCADGRCHGTKNGRPLYSDDNHLSEFGNKLLVPMFAEVF